MKVSPFLMLLLAITFVILVPLGTIWSLNTLFPVLNIDYSFETWVAALFLSNGIFGKHVKLMK